jgi:hypothetical protein
MVWYGLGSLARSVGSSCEHCNEPSGPIKCWEVLEHMSDRLLLKKD